MASGRSKEAKAAGSSDEAAVSSPGPDVAAAAAAPGASVDDDEAAAAAAAVSPAPAAPARPYYECVFCKRGFTTAQALGGHMNIHRRDRAKPNRESRDTHTPSGMASVSRNVPHPPAPPATTMPMMSSSNSSFAMYRSTRGAATGVVDGGEAASMSPGSASPRELSLFGAAARDHDLHLGLGCHGRGGDVGSHASPEGSERQAGDQAPERELDLELRLGRRPRH